MNSIEKWETAKIQLLKRSEFFGVPKRIHYPLKLRPELVSTKRSLLSEIAKLFDPLGWSAPVLISMNILLQQLWLAGLSWDNPLPNLIQTTWNEF